MKLEHSLTLYIKINSKWFKHLNTRHETIKLIEGKKKKNKLIEGNTGKTFSDINHASVSLGQSPKATEMKTKIKMGPNKFTSFSTAKDTINKMKKQATKWEKTCKLCNQVLNFQNIQIVRTTHYQKKNTPIEKWAEDLNRHFPKEAIQMTGTRKDVHHH